MIAERVLDSDVTGSHQRGAGGMSTASYVVACQNVLVATRQVFVGDALYAALCCVVVVQLSPAITNHRRMQSYFGAVPSSTAIAEVESLGSGAADKLSSRRDNLTTATTMLRSLLAMSSKHVPHAHRVVYRYCCV